VRETLAVLILGGTQKAERDREREREREITEEEEEEEEEEKERGEGKENVKLAFYNKPTLVITNSLP
jgi:hypothetical protein